jgi:predicted enzyme related to lactoylglutathione lyase
MELNAARIFVKDLESAKNFYSATLGLVVKADGSEYGYCVFKAGSIDLVVESVADDAPEEDRVLVGRFTGLSFTVQDIEAKQQELAARGVRFTGLPEKQSWGGILATLQDPSGNELQIVQHPAAA